VEVQKKPVTKAMEGGSAAPSKGKTTRGGSAKGGGMFNYKEKKETLMDRELQQQKTLMDRELQELQQQKARMENELEKLSTQINELKVGLKLHRLYIKAILEKYPKPEAEQIINTVTDKIK
jgi:hypothetical protein